MALRPELALAREDLKLQQLNVINVKNLLLPDLRFLSTYAPNSIGTSLDGTVDNAFRSLASDHFVDWTVGLRLNYTLGYRDAYAQLRTARLDLARSYGVLREQESKAQMALAVDYRHLFEYYELIQIQRVQREAAAVQLQARFKEYQAGRGTLDILLESHACGPTPCAWSSMPSPNTTTPSSAMNSPRGRSCSSTTWSSPRDLCRTVPQMPRRGT